MSGRCVKILVLVMLIPVALRASSLLVGGHGGVPATSWHVSRRRPAATASVATTGLSVSAGSSVRKGYQHSARRQWTESAVAAVDNRRLRRVDGGDSFEDDKRLAPTGSNPLHNLRR
jgi:hypothetical protein